MIIIMIIIIIIIIIVEQWVACPNDGMYLFGVAPLSSPVCEGQ